MRLPTNAIGCCLLLPELGVCVRVLVMTQQRKEQRKRAESKQGNSDTALTRIPMNTDYWLSFMVVHMGSVRFVN